MEQQKFLESFDLKPEVLTVSDGSKILGGIVSGSADMSTMSGFGQIFPAIERGAPLKVIGGAAVLPTLSLYTGKADVKTLKDLEGRTVGSGSVGALLHQLSVQLLKKNGVDVSKVRFVNVGSSADVLRAVSAGVVDGGVGETSLIPAGPRLKIRLIEHGNMTLELKEFTFQGSWASDKAIKEKRDVLVRTLAAYCKLYRFVQSPAAKDAFIEANKSVFKNAPLEEREMQWNFVQEYKPYSLDITLSKERIDYMQNINKSFAVQKTILPFEKVADMSLAADAVKLLK